MVKLTSIHAIEQQILRDPQDCVLYCGDKPVAKFKAIIELARQQKVEIQNTSQQDLDRMANGAHKGGILMVPEHLVPKTGNYEELLANCLSEARTSQWPPLLLALDGLSDPHNLGAILRSSDIFEADGVLLPSHRSVRLNDTVSRTSAGADQWVSVVEVTNLNRSIKLAKEQGFWVLGADMNGVPIGSIDTNLPLMLIMGSEGDGLSSLVHSNCDHIVSIPQGGHLESLNVSVACAVLLYAIRSKQGFGSTPKKKN